MTDVFRKEYKPLSDAQKSVVNAIKDNGQLLQDSLENCPVEFNPRAMAIAKTKLEEAVMWAVKAVTA